MNDKTESQGQGQGRIVTLPGGAKRIDFIRDNYYDPKTHTHTEKCMSRSAIKNAINEGLPEDKQIPYQIVFAATKLPTDPRVEAAARNKERAEAKAAKIASSVERIRAVLIFDDVIAFSSFLYFNNNTAFIPCGRQACQAS